MKQKVILVKGLPGSGKTTWTKQFCKKNPQFKRINKDDLRAMLDDSVWSKSNEKFVLVMRDLLITHTLVAGLSVVVDDTNLHPKHEAQVRKIAETFGIPIPFSVKDFTNVSLDVCIERDALREGRHKVGEAVIRNMYNQFLNHDTESTNQ